MGGGGGGWPPGPWKGGQGKGAAATREVLRTIWWQQTGGMLIKLFFIGMQFSLF